MTADAKIFLVVAIGLLVFALPLVLGARAMKRLKRRVEGLRESDKATSAAPDEGEALRGEPIDLPEVERIAG